MAENKKEDQPKKEEKKAAKVEDTKTIEKDEEKQEGTSPKAFPLKLIIILVLALLVAGGGFMVWKKMAASKDDKKGQIVAINDKDKGKPDMGPTYPMETFIVNLQDPNGRRYLKVQIVLELEDINLKQEIDQRMPQFKDAIISLLSSKTITDINTIEGKMQLRAELTAMFNQYLKSGKITNVFFMDFIIQ